MGSVPYDPAAIIYEPGQHALIAWNGKTELLILVTDLYANTKTKILEVMPLPSEPVVTEGDSGAITRAFKILEEKNPRREYESLSLEDISRKSSHQQPPAIITFHEQIGAHNISVAKMLDKHRFIQWVQNYLRSDGIESPSIPPELVDVIRDYINDGYCWFAFDVIELGSQKASKDALQFVFKSDHVYYPLRITRTETGSTTIKLIVLSEKLLQNASNINRQAVIFPYEAISINLKELKRIDPQLPAFFDYKKEIMLRAWVIRGNLRNFSEDLIVY